MFAVLEENFKKSKPQAPLTGAELAAAMKIGTRVVKGADWKWGDQVSSQILLIFCSNLYIYSLRILLL